MIVRKEKKKSLGGSEYVVVWEYDRCHYVALYLNGNRLGGSYTLGYNTAEKLWDEYCAIIKPVI